MTNCQRLHPITEQKLVHSELLYFLSNKYDNQPRSIIHDTVVDFYREDEIYAAKQLLAQHGDFSNCSSVLQYMKKRIGDNKIDRTVDDIYALFQAFDEGDARSRLPVFCAIFSARVPVTADEMSDMAEVKKKNLNIWKKNNFL